MVDQRPQDGGGGDPAERGDKRPGILAGLPLPAAVAGAHPGGVVEQVRSFCQHQSPRNIIASSPVIARSVSDKAIHSSFARQDGLLRGVYHRAHIRATRWLAMTSLSFPRSIITARANSMTSEVTDPQRV